MPLLLSCGRELHHEACQLRTDDPAPQKAIGDRVTSSSPSRAASNNNNKLTSRISSKHTHERSQLAGGPSMGNVKAAAGRALDASRMRLLLLLLIHGGQRAGSLRVVEMVFCARRVPVMVAQKTKKKRNWCVSTQSAMLSASKAVARGRRMTDVKFSWRGRYKDSLWLRKSWSRHSGEGFFLFFAKKSMSNERMEEGSW